VTPQGDAIVAARDVHIHQDTSGLPSAAASRPRRVWGGVPARNPGFAGREELLAAVRNALVSDDRAVVQALHGMGGVGKTQIAIEYAHRFSNEYDVVWWVNAENAALMGEQFAALAAALECAQLGTPLTAMRQAVHSELHHGRAWLLVFDNAENPEAIMEWLPGGSGHVLITSRAQSWDEVAIPVQVDVLARAESIDVLQHRVRSLSEADADTVAEALGDLPLAVAQAAGHMAQSGMSATAYTGLVAERAAEILEEGKPPSYPLSLAAVIQIGFDDLRIRDPATAELVAICAFLAPEAIPLSWFPRTAAQLPPALGNNAGDPLAWHRVVARFSRSALARVDPDGIVMHRLTQAIIRGHLPPASSLAIRAFAEAVVTANEPADTVTPGRWPAWARLLPHLLALNPAGSASQDVLAAVGRAAWYLVQRGDTRGGHDLARHLFDQWRDRLGPNDRNTLRVANTLSVALRQMGHYLQARDLGEDTFARRRRVLGEDHPDTLNSAGIFAASLRESGDHQAARELDEDTLARSRRVLGEDHPDTLAAAGILALDVCGLGDYRYARELEEDALARFRRVEGEDHPDTLTSANILAFIMRKQGERQAARELNGDTLARRRRVLGEDHPETLSSAADLAGDLYTLGDYQAARELYADTLVRSRRVLGDDHPLTQLLAHDLAVNLRMLREEPEP
jgi:hypothetical protein